jgi:hypothetical protein
MLELKPDESLLAAFDAVSHWLDMAPDINELVMAERYAALANWASWREVEMRFREDEAENAPEHWRRFGPRISPLTTSPPVL